MNKPTIVEKYTDNGEHSHWQLVNSDTGTVLWEEQSPEDEIIIIEGVRFRRGNIYDIYEIERDKKMFLNREAGFFVQTYSSEEKNGNSWRFGEKIPYESYPSEIRYKKDKWEERMKAAIRVWKQQ